MQENKSRLTVFYDGTFWIGIYERITEDKLEACKITFGAEPRDYEVYEFLLENWAGLRFSPPVNAGEKQEKRLSPKRMRRLVKKELEAHGTGTKSQQALQLQREENKMVRSRKSRAQKEEEKERHFELKQQKKKEKHRGR